MLKQDAHLHTPFCPHGTLDPFHSYIEKAMKKGFDSITFTEHAQRLLRFEIQRLSRIAP